MQQIHLKISGRVQGVFFRAHAQDKARQLGLKGWVRNTDAGDVEIVAQGEELKLAEFLDWCKKGPDSAEVIDVKAEWENFSSKREKYEDFQIRS